MELVDQLLAILAGPDPGMASRQLMAAGHTEDEVRGAWNYARSADYTESLSTCTGYAGYRPGWERTG